MINRAYLYFIIACIFLACTKEQKETVVSTPYTPDLKIQQVINDSTIVLKWPKYTEKNFGRYLVQRSATYIKNGQFETFDEFIDSSVDINDTVFTETRMPVAKTIVYTIYVSGPRDEQLATDFVIYERPPYTQFYGRIENVLIDTEQKKLYITHRSQQQKITVVDYTTGRLLYSKDVGGYIENPCTLGNFNGSKELYVPNGSSLTILDAATLEYKDAIYCGNIGGGSVVSANGNLYISTADTTGGTSECIKVYNRATKKLVARTGFWRGTSLLLLEGSSTEIIDIASPPDFSQAYNLSYYQFSEAGVPLLKKQDSYHGSYKVHPDILRSFPDGSKFITSAAGTIFNKSLVFDRYLKQDGYYSDYAFNSDGSVIYAANIGQKKIDAFNYPACTLIRSYSTSMYPYKVFRDGNTLICLNITAPEWHQSNTCFVQKIDL